MAIPPYPASRPLALTDKPLLDELFALLQPRVSEFTFANLYLFRAAHAYRLSMSGTALLILGRGYDGVPYALPPVGGDIQAATTTLLQDGLTIYGADDPFVAGLQSKEEVELWEDRDNFDYLYRRQELADLAGNRFHKKKNRVAYFAKRHAYTVVPYAPEHQADCQALTEEWYRVRSVMESRSLAQETAATVEALRLAAELGLEGIVVLVGGVGRAFALGERLNRTTAICHFEKADPFLEGLTQLTNREFNRLLFTDCTYANREQDLGEPGLREAKLSYHPAELIKKYRLRRRRG
jgi:uncharacterized protein